MNAPSSIPQPRDFGRLALPAILVCTFLLSLAWALATPVAHIVPTDLVWGNFHPDEGSHVAVIDFMATHRALPPYRDLYATSVHPPLYHGMGALVYGLAVAGGASYDRAMLMVRVCTAFCGVGIVYLTFAATRRVASRETAIFAALLVALVPMRASLGGGVNNENLAALGAAGVLATLVGGFCASDGFTYRRALLLTLYLVVGIGSKITCLGLLPVALFAVVWRGRMRKQRSVVTAASMAMIVLVPLVCWGWWFARNQRLYGDPFRQHIVDRMWNTVQPGYAAIAAIRPLPVWSYALSVILHGYLSFWGKFDGFRYYMPLPVYALPLVLEIVGLIGLRRLLRPPDPDAEGGIVANMSHRRETFLLPGQWENFRRLALLFALYAAFVVVIFLRYNWTHFTPQGRYFFVLLIPYGMLFALGWRAALSPRAQRWATPTLLGLMLALNLYVLYVVPHRISMPLGIEKLRQDRLTKSAGAI